MKKILLSLLCITTLISLTGCNSEKKEEETSKGEVQAGFIEDQQIDNLSFESFNVVLDDNNISHIYFEVINNGTEANNASKVTFKLYKDSTNLLTLTKSLNGPIEANDLRIIESSVDIDLSDVNKVEYIVE